MTAGGVRVLLFHTAADAEGIRQAYERVSERLAGVPGLLGNELLQSADDRTDFVVISWWQDMDAFTSWERGQEHRNDTAPLRPYRGGGRGAPFGIYQVLAAH
jgi:heme-degrading monooxygenase HmoA